MDSAQKLSGAWRRQPVERRAHRGGIRLQPAEPVPSRAAVRSRQVVVWERGWCKGNIVYSDRLSRVRRDSVWIPEAGVGRVALP